jgi:biotin carboxylase
MTMSGIPAAAAGSTVLLIAGRSAPEFEAVRALGFRIAYLDNYVPMRCIPWADVPVDVDLDDFAAVTRTVRRLFRAEPPAAVLTHVEPRLPLMAHLVDELGLPVRGLPAEAAANCRDKWRTRLLLEDAGLPSPTSFLVTTAEEALAAAGRLGLPVIVKPRGGTGGSGVRLCRTGPEVAEAVEVALREPDHGHQSAGALVEQYIAGPEYAVQALTRGGRTEIVSVFRQTVTGPPVFVETGYASPAGLSGEQQAELADVVTRALAAVGVDNWVSHTQVRLDADGFHLIEINARRPGGRLVEMTTAVSGTDLVRAATEIAVGLEVTRGRPTAGAAAYRSIVFDTAGTLDYRPEVAPARPGRPAPVVELDVAPGDPVLPVGHPDGGVYGRVVTFADSLAEAQADADEVLAALALEVRPDGTVAEDSREFKSCC